MGGYIKVVWKYALKGFAGKIKAKYLPALAAKIGSLAIIEPDVKVKAQMYFATKTTGARTRAWNYLNQTYGYYGSPDISIAIVDSGLSPEHKMLKGWSDAASNSSVWSDTSTKIVGWHDAVGSTSSPSDDNGHGSHCGGIAAGKFFDMKVDASNRLVVKDAFGVIYDDAYISNNGDYYVSPSTSVRVLEGSQTIYVEVYHQDISAQGLGSSHNSDLAQLNVTDPNGNVIATINDNGAGDLDSTDDIIKANINIGSTTGVYKFTYKITLHVQYGFVKRGGPGYVFWSYIHMNRYPDQDDGYERISGVAPDTKLVGVKVLDNTGSGVIDDVASGIDWLVQNKDTYHIVMASCSFGIGQATASVESAINNGVNNGIIFFVAAGNSGPDSNTVSSPGYLDSVITVAASNVGIDGTIGITSYSSRGPDGTALDSSLTTNTTKPDIAAPGGDSSGEATIMSVDSSTNDDADVYRIYQYGTQYTIEIIKEARSEEFTNDLTIFQGTSMATPYAAGVGALLVSAMISNDWDNWPYTSSKVFKVKQILSLTAWEIDEKNRGGKDPAEGFGLLQIDAAIDAYKKPYSIGTYVAKGLGSSYTSRHVWARKVYLTSGHTYTFDLTVPAGADFDIYLWAPDPKAASESKWNTWGEPLLVAWGNNTQEGADEHITYTPSTSGWYYLTIKQISGSGTFQFNSTEQVNPPSCEIVNPSSGDEVSGTITVQVSASDTSPGSVEYVELYIDGGSPVNMTYNSGSGYWEYSLDTTDLSEGQHTLQAKAVDDEGNYGWSNVIEIIVNNYPAEVLLVDDDQSPSYDDYSIFYKQALEDLGVDYDYYVVPDQSDGPSATYMSSYNYVIWYTGDTWGYSGSAGTYETLTSNDRSNLATYLDGGGKVMISGQDIIYDIEGEGATSVSDSFLSNYMALDGVTQDLDPPPSSVSGVSGTVFENASYNLSGGDGGDNNDFPDSVSPNTNAPGSEGKALTWPDEGGAVIWHDATTYKTLFFAFNFESISTRDERKDCMYRSLHFLGYDFAPQASITSPEDGSGTNQNSITVYWNATDDYGVSKHEVYLDNSLQTTITETGSPTSVQHSYTLTGLSDGLHTIKIITYDSSNNKGIDEVTIWVDFTPPTVTITSPSDGQNFPDVPSDVSVTWTGSDNYELDHYEVRCYNSSWDSGWINVYLNMSYVFSNLGSGSYTAEVKAYDTAGNTDTDTVSFSVGTSDTNPPTVTITSPSDGSVFDTDSITVQWTSNDAESGINHHEIYLDGSAVDTNIPASQTSYTLTGLGDGSHTIEVRAVDNAGNTGSDSVSITVDTTPPTITISSPNDGDIFDTDTITVTWSGSDSTTGIDHYEIYDNGNAVDTNIPASQTSYTLTGLGDGSHTIEVRAVDGAGNTGSDSVSITVDTTAPTVTITSPSDGAILDNSTVVVQWSGSDATTGIDHYELYLDGSPVDTNIPSSQNSYTLSGLGDGSHTIEVRAVDGAGNTGSDSVSITIQEPPEVNIESPTEDQSSGEAYVGGDTVVVSWSGSDNSGIDHYEVSVDSGSWTNIGLSTNYETTFSTEGVHNITVRAYDENGNYDEDVIQVVVDWSDPSISLTCPSAMTSDSGTASIQVTWSGSDAVSGIDHYEIFVDGSWINVGNVTSYNIDTSSMSDGIYAVFVRAFDRAGYYSQTTLLLIVDKTAPSLSIVNPADGSYIADTSVVVSWTASDNIIGIDHFEVRVDSGSWTNVGRETAYLVTGLSEAPHTIYVRAYDAAGNYVEASVSITVDLADPDVSITSPTDGGVVSSSSVTVQWSSTATDIAYYLVRRDDGSWINVGTSTSYTFSGVADGVHTVYVVAVDNAGRRAMDYVVFIVDTTAGGSSAPDFGKDLSPLPASAYSSSESSSRVAVLERDNIDDDSVVVSVVSVVKEDVVGGYNTVDFVVANEDRAPNSGIVVIGITGNNIHKNIVMTSIVILKNDNKEGTVSFLSSDESSMIIRNMFLMYSPYIIMPPN